MAWWHIQQVGEKPTYVGVACADVDLGRAFTRELLCGGRLWPELRRHHLLFVVTEFAVEVWVGESMKDSSQLSEIATRSVLGRARRARDESMAMEERRKTALGELWRFRGTGVLRPAWRQASLAGTAVAVEVVGDRCLAVYGDLAQTEAEHLVRDLIQKSAWSPLAMGHTSIECRRKSLRINCTRPVSLDRKLTLRRVVEGFLRTVVISDLHLGVKGRDTFGGLKECALVALLDRVIEQRSTLVLNGDFLELLHEPYGAIKRSYPRVFARLRRVRRVIYVAGNHDEDILRERTKEVRRWARHKARRRAYATVRWDAAGVPVVEIGNSASLPIPRPEAWRSLLGQPAVADWIREVLVDRRGCIWLSSGLSGEGVAFERRGPRGSSAERPTWYLDEALLKEADPAGYLLKLVADRRQRLDRVIRRDWGPCVQIGPFYWDEARGQYFEHGHAAIPFCNGSKLGRRVSVMSGVLKRWGVTQIEHFFEERIGRWVRAVYPWGRVREIRQFAERTLAVAQWLSRGEQPRGPLSILCGHTHEAANVTAEPVHAITKALTGVSYGNTGAWSSRLRLSQAGETRAEWLEIDAVGRSLVRSVDVGSEDSAWDLSFGEREGFQASWGQSTAS
jgi:UDP-2,3-diacylglucosamine pyrophosphatase LpxH